MFCKSLLFIFLPQYASIHFWELLCVCCLSHTLTQAVQASSGMTNTLSVAVYTMPFKWESRRETDRPVTDPDRSLGVDRLSAPILSILPIIDIGHFQNRFANNFFFFIMQTNILFTGDIIYWWINNTGEIIWFLNALFGSMQPVWAQHSVRVRRSLNLWEQSPPTAHLICRESRVVENWRQSHTESTC